MFGVPDIDESFFQPIGLLSANIAVETVDVHGAPLTTTGTTVTIADTAVTSSNSTSVGSIIIRTGSPYNAPLSVSPAPGYIVSRIAAVHHTTLTDLTETFPVLGAETLRIFLSKCTLMGDVNGDGVVDQKDADLLFNWVAYQNLRNTTYKLACPECADVTGNGSINIGDAVLLMNHVKFPDDPAFALAEPRICAEGEKRSPTTCWDGSVINAEVCRNNVWIPTGETCPTKPECTTGDKKAGYVCAAGKWVPVVVGSYDLQRRVDERNVWNFTPLTLRAVNNTGERAYIEIGIWLDGVYKKYYDQPLSPTGSVTFEINKYLKAGSYSNSLPIGEGTHIIETPDRKKKIEIKVWDLGREGELRSSVKCWDGSLIFREVYRSGEWVSTGETCPPEPAAGEKRLPHTCWDDSIIYTEVYDAALHRWVPSGEKCPLKVCNEGEKRSPKTCWDSSVIHEQVCRNNALVPSGETCPPKQECREGDKKAGYVCVAGKWQTAPAVPEPVPPAECREGDKKAGYVCVAGKWRAAPVPPVEPVPEPVPPVEPVSPVMPPADEMFTIEFQELIPGVTPPRVPLLIPGLETLPLLPGWIVRDAAGNIVNKGAELPTLQEIEKQ